MNPSDLQAFVMAALSAGVRSDKTLREEIIDHERVRAIQVGDFRFKEVLAGTSQQYGKATVFYQGRPCWSMIMAGGVIGLRPKDEAGILSFHLQGLRALLSMNQTSFHSGNMVLHLHWDGDLAKFTKAEYITLNGQEVFRLNFRGGMVR